MNTVAPSPFIAHRLALPAPLAVLLSLVAGTACSGGGGGPFALDDGPAMPSRIEAVAGVGGVALFTDAPVPPEAVVTARDPGGVTREIAWTGASRSTDASGVVGTVYDITIDGTLVATAPALELGAELTTVPTPALVLAGEPVSLTWSLSPGTWTMPVGDLVLTRVDGETDDVQYLVRDCLGTDPVDPSCWSGDVTALVDGLDAADLAELGPVELPWYEPVADAPRLEKLGLWWRLVDDDGAAVHAGAATPVVALAASLRWGDVHAHSGLSSDGCEDIDNSCRYRGDRPGGDFFSNAVAAGLDFAAITDHAEYDLINDGEEATLVIWDETLELIDLAEQDLGEGFIPILGYEWTSRMPSPSLGPDDDPVAFADEFRAGHKTVLFKDPYACGAYRIAPVTNREMFVKGPSGLIYLQADDQRVAHDPQELLELLDQAEEECGTQPYLVFFHHSATANPSPVNWALEQNVPIEQTEMLVEIASSHGSSECRDRSQDGCEALTNDRTGCEPLWWGSVQEALSLGYRLGFVGGSDRHDGRPGTLDQGPSWIGNWHEDDGDQGSFSRMWGPGAITGVWVRGPFDRQGLWEALTSRRTLATSGPRGHVSAVAFGADGALLLPGDTVTEEDFPLHLWAAVRPDQGFTLDRIEVIDPVDGSTVATAAAGALDVTIDDPGGPALYVRARLHDGDLEDHRIWITPWFVTR